MSFWPLLLLLALVGSAFFAGSETAMVSSSRLRQRAAREGGQPRAGLAERLYQRPERTLAVLLLGNNLSAVISSVSAVIITEKLLAGQGLDLPPLTLDLVSTLWVVALVLVVGEVVPKGLGFLYADRITRMVAPLLVALNAVLGPPLLLIEKASRGIARLGSSAPLPGESSPSWETVRLHLETGREEGVLDADEEALIRRIALLNRLTARSLMIPLAELVLHPAGGSLDELRRGLKGRSPSRCFLYEGRPGNLTGVLRLLHLLGLPGDRPLAELARPLRKVPATRPLLDLIDELQFTRSKFAVVTDLSGEALGVVYLQNLLGQLVRVRGAGETLNNLDSLS